MTGAEVVDRDSAAGCSQRREPALEVGVVEAAMLGDLGDHPVGVGAERGAEAGRRDRLRRDVHAQGDVHGSSGSASISTCTASSSSGIPRSTCQASANQRSGRWAGSPGKHASAS